MGVSQDLLRSGMASLRPIAAHFTTWSYCSIFSLGIVGGNPLALKGWRRLPRHFGSLDLGLSIASWCGIPWSSAFLSTASWCGIHLWCGKCSRNWCFWTWIRLPLSKSETQPEPQRTVDKKLLEDLYISLCMLYVNYWNFIKNDSDRYSILSFYLLWISIIFEIIQARNMKRYRKISITHKHSKIHIQTRGCTNTHTYTNSTISTIEKNKNNLANVCSWLAGYTYKRLKLHAI